MAHAERDTDVLHCGFLNFTDHNKMDTACNYVLNNCSIASDTLYSCTEQLQDNSCIDFSDTDLLCFDSDLSYDKLSKSCLYDTYCACLSFLLHEQNWSEGTLPGREYCQLTLSDTYSEFNPRQNIVRGPTDHSNNSTLI